MTATQEQRCFELISDATALIEAEVGQVWGTITETRHFPCSGIKRLNIDAALSITSVTIATPGYADQALIVDQDYSLAPSGAGNDEASYPVRQLVAAGRWPKAPAYAVIVAEWATSEAAPRDVQLATAFTVAAWLRAQGIGTEASANVKAESWGDYTVTFGGDQGSRTGSPREIPAEAASIIARYRENGGSDEPTIGGA
jgi:hypothetical protein